MPLIRYSQYISYPDGSPASEIEVAVWLLGGNVPIPVFADKAGTTPVSNPVMTDGDGLISVYAAPGAVTAELAGQLFHFLVDATETDDAWPGTFIHTQVSTATTWTIAHHFGIEPVVDSLVLSSPMQGEVSHPDTETTTITFGAPVSGVAYLRR
jgi:hypothetical protein